MRPRHLKGLINGKPIKCTLCGCRFFKDTHHGRTPGYCSESCRRAKKLARDQELNPRRSGTSAESILRRRASIPRCRRCNVEIDSRYSTAMWCSQECRNRFQIEAKPLRTCKTCETSIPRRPGRGTDRFYCSGKCVPKIIRKGYVAIECAGHPVANASGWQFEHRVVLYDAIGPELYPCHYCWRLLSWDLHYNAPGGMGVDHLDYDTTNNKIENLVPCCRSCNCARRRKRTFTCEQCGDQFSTAGHGAKFCSSKCYSRNYRSRTKQKVA
jgi:hypothetical protein